MKYHIAFLTGLIAVLGLFSYFVFSFNESGLFYFHRDKVDLTQVLRAFQQNTSPQLEINFSALYGRPGQMQVLHPILDVRQLKIEKVHVLCNKDTAQTFKVSGRESSCQSTTAEINEEDESAIGTRKTAALRRFLSGKADLPENFLSTSPFVDQEGYSYAYWLVKTAASPYNEKSWVERHLSYFKISELRELLATYNISDPTYNFTAELKDSEIEMAVRGEPLILTAKYLMLRDQSSYGFSPLSYWVYDLAVFEGALKNGDYELEPLTANTFCLQRVGNACWTYSSKYALAYLYRYSVAILVMLGLVFLVFLAFYMKRLYDKNKEQQKHRLSLQVLSHEFRTPVSSMLLMIDQLTKDGRNLDLSDQELLIRISAEIFRLQRIVEVSKTYLQAEGGRIHFRPVAISSINTWIADFITESNLNIQCEPLQVDRGFTADPFWLKFILSSLVQNAFMHGAEPVSIRLESVKDVLKITVQDHGRCEYKSLNRMTEAFVKSQRSKGMGLGLNIVKYIVEDWGGEIRFSNAPTSFTLVFGRTKLKGVPYGEDFIG